MNSLISACEYNAEQVAMQSIQYSQTLKKDNDVHCGSQNVSHNVQTVHHLHRHSLTVSCTTV